MDQAVNVRTGADPPHLAHSSIQTRSVLRQRLEAIAHDVDEVWDVALDSGDYELVSCYVEASQAVHRAVVALGAGRIGSAGGPSGPTW